MNDVAAVGVRVSFSEEREGGGAGAMPKPRSNSVSTTVTGSPCFLPGSEGITAHSPDKTSFCAVRALMGASLTISTRDDPEHDVCLLGAFNMGEGMPRRPSLNVDVRPPAYISPVSVSVGSSSALMSHTASGHFSDVSEATSKRPCIGDEESRSESPFDYSEAAASDGRESPQDFIEAAGDVRDYSRWLAERELPKVVHLDQAFDICRHKVVVRLKTMPYIVHRQGLGLAVKITQFPLLRLKSVPIDDDSDASSFSSEG